MNINEITAKFLNEDNIFKPKGSVGGVRFEGEQLRTLKVSNDWGWFIYDIHMKVSGQKNGEDEKNKEKEKLMSVADKEVYKIKKKFQSDIQKVVNKLKNDIEGVR